VVWNEKQDVQLNSALRIDIAPVPGWCGNDYTKAGGSCVLTNTTTIPAGTMVDSHFLHHDPVNPTGPDRSGCISFDSDILGLIAQDNQLDSSETAGHDLQAAGFGGYDTHLVAQRGLEFDTNNDYVYVHTNRELCVNFDTNTATDEVRVITAGVKSIALSPTSGSDGAGFQHCVTATVTTDTFAGKGGDGAPNVMVRFSVSGANSAAGALATLSNGQTPPFCYTGSNAGADAISAYADSDGDGARDLSGCSLSSAATPAPCEPGATAPQVWTCPGNAAAPNADGNNAALNRGGQDGLIDTCDTNMSGDGYTNAQHTALGKDPLLYCVIMRVDYNGDNVVNGLDLNVLGKNYLKTYTRVDPPDGVDVSVPMSVQRVDANGDLVINGLDLNILSKNYLKTASQCPTAPQ
jgi:hypothetical protein